MFWLVWVVREVGVVRRCQDCMGPVTLDTPFFVTMFYIVFVYLRYRIVIFSSFASYIFEESTVRNGLFPER